jgi:hypothetical protein
MNAEGYPWTFKTTESFVNALCHDGPRESRKPGCEEAGEPDLRDATMALSTF